MDTVSDSIQVTAERVKKALDTHESCVIIDVRTPQEFARGRIQGSLNLPVDSIADSLPAAVTDINTTIYVYCLSGSRSIHAVYAIRALGYTKAFDMKSGLLAWRALGYPLMS